MKRKFSKILGVGVTLALLTSLLLTAAPVSALSPPSVSLDDPTISAKTNYTIMFTLGKDLDVGERIVIDFPTGTNIDAITDLAGVNLDALEADVTIAATSGIGSEPVSITAAASTSTTGGTKLTITVPDAINIAGFIGAGAMVQVVVGNYVVGDPPTGNGVVNPPTIGDYTLTVGTLDTAGVVIVEAAVTSAAYSIIAPVILGLPGVVKWYNTAGVLMGSKTDPNAIWEAIDGSAAGYTIEVGPGTYISTSENNLDISPDLEGLTLKSTDGAATTIIDATGLTGYAITIGADKVTVDGFTIKSPTGGAITVTGADAIVKNNIITADDGWPDVHLAASGATISGNELSINNTMMVIGATDCTLSGNTFGAGINVQCSTGITITGNDIIGAEWIGICFEGSTVSEDIMIEGNTISETTESANPRDAGIGFGNGAGGVDKLQIIGNDITDNLVPGIVIPDDVIFTDYVIKFNTITGNEGYGINSAAAVDATFNWWGTTVAADIAAMVSVGVTYDPFLVDTAEAVFSASEAIAATLLDASTTVGVAVSGAINANVIAVAKYTANPQEALADALAFYDVYVAGAVDTEAIITIKLYGAVTENTEAYVWSTLQGQWVKCSDQGPNTFGGFVYVTVKVATIPAITDLAGTPFALVQPPVEEEVMAAPNVIALAQAATDISLTPTFVWDPVAGATAYELQVARYPNFAGLVIDKTLESGALLEVPFFASDVDLDYSTIYYWRVRAVSVQDWVSEYIDQGAWVTRVFTTIAEPEAVVYTCPQCGLTFDTEPALETHVAEAHPPAAPLVTPSYIWVIIAVGAVLALAVIILIVRTRRVA